jgi:hypothetical protein
VLWALGMAAASADNCGPCGLDVTFRVNEIAAQAGETGRMDFEEIRVTVTMQGTTRSVATVRVTARDGAPTFRLAEPLSLRAAQAPTDIVFGVVIFDRDPRRGRDRGTDQGSASVTLRAVDCGGAPVVATTVDMGRGGVASLVVSGVVRQNAPLVGQPFTYQAVMVDGRCIGVEEGAEHVDGAPLRFGPCPNLTTTDAARRHSWTIETDGSGNSAFRNICTRKCWDLPVGGSRPNQFTCHGGDAQKWHMDTGALLGSRLRPKLQPSVCLRLPEAGPDRDIATVGDCMFRRPFANIVHVHLMPLIDPTHEFRIETRSLEFANHCLEVRADRKPQAQLAVCSMDRHQRFRFELRAGENMYRMRMVGDDRCVGFSPDFRVIVLACADDPQDLPFRNRWAVVRVPSVLAGTARHEIRMSTEGLCMRFEPGNLHLPRAEDCVRVGHHWHLERLR